MPESPRFPSLILNEAAAARVGRGHLWVFANEVAKTEGTPVNGAEVAVLAPKGEYLGTGLYNKHALIAARLYTRRPEPFTADFLRARIRTAVALRDQFVAGRNGRRLVFGESDLLPGLIVDQYGPVLSIQLLTLAMDQRRDLVVDVLQELLSPLAIVERGDTPAREHEGLPQVKGVLRGAVPDGLTVDLEGLVFRANPLEGQKTGLYLDQVENWRLMHQYARGRRVLDLFSNVGGFGLNAARAGAESVRMVDSSELALSEAMLNAAANGLADRVRTRQSDAFQYVRSLPEQFDLVVCDPPPFARSRKQLETALRGYREVNRQCLKLLPAGGILISCSCSAALSDADFDKMLAIAARDAGRMIRLLPGGAQPLDHAPLLSMPETQYLKTRVVQVV